MPFIFSQWEKFCTGLKNAGIISVQPSFLLKEKPLSRFLVLKHDVETDPSKALIMAKIENTHGHRGVYYVQAYLLGSEKNIDILKKIQSLGHEVSYHHDVMDQCKGDILKAADEFEKNADKFRKCGFTVSTVCQHGNPVIERKGYTSNRDLFRDGVTAERFRGISEIMVNFRNRINADYKYISDAGYGWKIIFDPENNDVVPSSDKDVPLDSFDDVLKAAGDNSVIISTHPHRWHENAVKAFVKDTTFRIIRTSAKTAIKIPGMKRLMGRFYYIAKKI
ncbi:MAG TPA: hypothetical protein PLK90_11450 [Clostridiales bacterium]|nr:hypothetical protein [Clostridiales bacterium]HQP71005.1 hypothetical protein [Clostridiales bacterium]